MTAAADSSEPSAFNVSADEHLIHIQGLPASTADVRVVAIPPYVWPSEDGQVVFRGTVDAEGLRIPRIQGELDLLYCRFLVQDANGKPVGKSQWVTDPEAIPQRDHAMPWPKSIKGVTTPEDFDDLVELGVKHVHINLGLSELILPANAPDPPQAFTREIMGHRLRFNPKTVERWDHKIGQLTQRDINAVAVILNPMPHRPEQATALLHPDTSWDAPHRLGAFNLTSRQGVATYVAALSFLAERYSRPDKAHGWIGGYIIGNEVDSHWVWHNMGEVPVEDIAAQYHREVRLAWLAVRQHHPEPPVFISLTHSWSRPNSRHKFKNCAGRDLLDRLAALARDGGDFGWHVAYHPYPQNLFEPRYWNDVMAMYGYDSPMITFKNIEVLSAYLDRESMRYHGRHRRIILSEQGFHTPDGPEGEKIQAAAYALAFHRIARVPEIEAFILHRHVDHPDEGGLALGLRRQPGQNSSAGLGAKKRSWDVFRIAGTPHWHKQATFALEVAGYDHWGQANPRPGPFPKHAPGWETFAKSSDVFFDLLAQVGEATPSNALSVADRVVTLSDGGLAEALMLHPQAAGSPPATLDYRIDLPADQAATLRFQTHLSKAESSGVIFRVRANGRKLFELPVADLTIRDHRVDLSPMAGQSITLTLEVDPGKNNHYDSALWITPAITLTAKKD